MKPVRIPAGDMELNGNLFLPPNPPTGDGEKFPGVVHLHGWRSSQNRAFEISKLLSAMGFICLTVDLRGHGASPGIIEEFSRKHFLEDCVAAYDVLIAEEEVDKDDITVAGSSFGGYLAALLTKERKASRLILRVPSDYPDEGFEKSKMDIDSKSDTRTEWRSEPKTWKETAALRAVHDFREEILLIESEKDELVPRQTLQNYREAVENPELLTYVTIKDAPHSLRDRPDLQREYEKIVVDWIINQ